MHEGKFTEIKRKCGNNDNEPAALALTTRLRTVRVRTRAFGPRVYKFILLLR